MSAGQGLLQDLHASVSPELPAGHLGQGVNRRREGGQGVEIRSAHPGSSRCSRDSASYAFLQCSFRPPLWGPSDSEMWGLQESPHCGLPRESEAWICLPTTQGPTWSLDAVPRQGRGQSYRDSDQGWGWDQTVARDAGNSGYQACPLRVYVSHRQSRTQRVVVETQVTVLGDTAMWTGLRGSLALRSPPRVPQPSPPALTQPSRVLLIFRPCHCLTRL